jgi:hypothetical protein
MDIDATLLRFLQGCSATALPDAENLHLIVGSRRTQDRSATRKAPLAAPLCSIAHRGFHAPSTSYGGSHMMYDPAAEHKKKGSGVGTTVLRPAISPAPRRLCPGLRRELFHGTRRISV